MCPHSCFAGLGEVSGVSGLGIETVFLALSLLQPPRVWCSWERQGLPKGLFTPQAPPWSRSLCFRHWGPSWFPQYIASVGMRAPRGPPTHSSSALLQPLAGEGDPSSPLPAGVESLCRWEGTVGSTEGAKGESCSRLGSALQGASKRGARPVLQML